MATKSVTKPTPAPTKPAQPFNMEAEIKSKAERGVPLSKPTPEKQALYNQYQQAKANDVALKAMTGQTLSNNAPDWQKSVWNMYANQQKLAPNGDNALQFMQQQQQVAQNEAAKQLQALSRYLQQSAQMQFVSQAAMLTQQRDAQIAQLEQAYSDAVSEGQMSIREAQQAFEAQKAEIEKQAYQQAQATQLMAQNLGIQNSQHLLGHVSADNQVINSMINQNMTTRDKRIADIKDRIANLKNKKNLDVINAQKEFGANLIKAYGDISGKMYDQQFQMQYDNFQRNREENFQINQMGFQHKMDLEKMDKQNILQLGQIAYQNGLDLEKMNAEQVMKFAIMAKQHGYDIDLAKVQDFLERGRMAQQYRYDMQKANLEFKNQSALNSQQFQFQKQLNEQELQLEVQKMQKQMELDHQIQLREYDDAVKRELAKYKPGTPEYEIRQAQLADERQKLLTQMATETQFDALSKYILNGQTEPPKKPTKSWWESESHYKKELKEYKEKLKAYKRYQEFLKNPLSVFP